jgi:pyruvate kinase
MPVDQIEIKDGEMLLFGEESFKSEVKGFSITHPHIIEHLKDGQSIIADDGAYTFSVVKRDNQTYLQSHTTGILKTRKTLNIPGADFPFPVLIERDFDGLKLAARHDVDFVALSFVRSAADVSTVKEEMKKHKVHAKIIAKIETQKAIDHLDAIIEVSDGVMVARGDLGVEIPIEQVPYYQKMMIKSCMIQDKFVITATQMLQTMIENPYPTRAEVSDIANAVYDHTDCLMLSGETASGAYPIKAVEMMAKTAYFYELKAQDDIRVKIPYSAADSTALLCDTAYDLYREYVKHDLPIAGFLVFSQSGKTAETLSRYRPNAPIFAFVPTAQKVESLTIRYGVFPQTFSFKEADEVKIEEIHKAIKMLQGKKMLKEGKLIVVHGDKWGQGSGATTIRIV